MRQVRFAGPDRTTGHVPLHRHELYRKHVEEAKRMGVAVPDKQFCFNGQTSCIACPYDGIDPAVSEALDREVELDVVIARRARRVAKAQANDHVFGYLVCNDVSAPIGGNIPRRS